MKTTARNFLLVLVILATSSVAFAQEEEKQDCPKHSHRHSHHFHSCDSTCSGDFSCYMPNFDMDDFPFFKKKKNKYNGHWAGVEIGINGYVTPDFDMNFTTKDPYMNINTARSLMVNLNLYELNVNLYKQKLGFTTGFGFQFSNYYFTNDYILLQDSAALVAYKTRDQVGNAVDFKINKLFASYFNVPLLFEYQTNRYHRINSFHATLGVVLGVRIGSYTKQIYESLNQTYTLVDEKGAPVANYYVDKHVVRDRGPYHLSPFKVDAAFRIGWSHLNLFATYSLTQMFQKDQGPELYPWTVGITLLGW